MSNLVFGLAVICGVIVFGAAITSLATFLNRRTIRIDSEGQRFARERLMNRPQLDKQETLAALDVRPDNEEGAWNLLEEIAAVFGANPGRFRADDLLHDLVTVRREELPTISDEAWRRTAFGGLDQFQVFPYDVMHLFDTHKGSRKLAKAGKLPSPAPASEEAWVDFVLGLSVREFIHVLLTEE